jgi:hypothetical protein
MSEEIREKKNRRTALLYTTAIQVVLVIALFFVGPFVNPARNVWVLYSGMMACVLVLPVAFICGSVRGIPFGWRLIDCSFGVFGFLPLWYALKQTQRLIKTTETAGVRS